MNINVVGVRACTESKQAEPMQINEKDCGSGFFFKFLFVWEVTG